MAFPGKTFVVTGAASGIGRETARMLLSRGATVHAIDLAPDIPSHSNVDEGKPTRYYTYPRVDVSARQDVRIAFGSIVQHTPNLSGLVNCAGLQRPSTHSGEDDDDAMLYKLFGVNTGGTWNTNTEFHRCTSHFRKTYAPGQSASSLSIVNIGSMASVRGIPHMSAYVASKHAVLGLTRTFAQEWGAQGIRVNLVAPGAVDTPMLAGALLDAEKTTSSVSGAYKGALGECAKPAQIASAALFLLGDAASHISGTVLEVNGGWP